MVLLPLFCLAEDAARLFFFFYVVLHVLAEHLYLRIVKLIARLHSLDFRDKLLRTVVLDLCFVEHVVFHVAAFFGIEDLFFDLRMHLERKGNLFEELASLSVAFELLVFVEPLFDLAVIFLEKADGERIAPAGTPRPPRL